MLDLLRRWLHRRYPSTPWEALGIATLAAGDHRRGDKTVTAAVIGTPEGGLIALHAQPLGHGHVRVWRCDTAATGRTGTWTETATYSSESAGQRAVLHAIADRGGLADHTPATALSQRPTTPIAIAAIRDAARTRAAAGGHRL
jgi:hypothetical protein